MEFTTRTTLHAVSPVEGQLLLDSVEAHECVSTRTFISVSIGDVSFLLDPEVAANLGQAITEAVDVVVLSGTLDAIGW